MKSTKNPTPVRRSQVSTFVGLGISAVVHLSVFLLVGGVVIFEGKIPDKLFFGSAESYGESEQAPELEMPLMEEEEEPDLSVDIAEDDLIVDPLDAFSESTIETEDIIASTNPTPTFTVPSITGSPSIGPDFGKVKVGGAKPKITKKGPKVGSGLKTLFGFTEEFSGALEGTMVDFKQDEKGKATKMTPSKFKDTIYRFANKSDWDVDKLAKDYFVVPQKLYATHFYIPHMKAEEAPKAFNVEDKVEPRMWMVVYKGSFASPKNGKFRFWGFADDVIVVRVNGKIEFDGSIDASRGGQSKVGVKFAKESRKHVIANGNFLVGDWFSLKQGKLNEIEVLVAEVPGGHFSTYLFIEEEGEKYKKVQGDRPRLPVFQTVKADIKKGSGVNFPEFDKKGIVFSP
ncbi:MAG: hypothetical protein AAF558_11150 [Verrucomicrobiota bacterium]